MNRIMSDTTNYGWVTELTHSLRREKDWAAIAEKYADKHGHDAQYWLDQWENKRKLAAEFGKSYHKSREEKYGGTAPLDLGDLVDGTYHELKIYSHIYEIIGRVDRVDVEANDVIITDIKTSEKLELEPTARWNPQLKRKTVEKYLPPCGHIPVTNYNDAALQLSIYGYMLELYGFNVKMLILEHVQFKGRKQGYKHLLECLDQSKLVETVREPYDVPYLKEEAKAILRQRKNLLRQW